MRMSFVWLVILGENKGGEEAANEKTREAKSPSQIDCLCVYPKVVLARYSCIGPVMAKLGRGRPSVFLRKPCLIVCYCQNPNSTNSSIEQNLRLDYILTPCRDPPHTISLLLLLTAPASQAHQTVQLYSHS